MDNLQEALKVYDTTYEVYWLKTEFFNMVNNVYIIVDKHTRQGAIIDPAWNIAYIKDMLYKIKVDLKGILLTHSHYDHTNLVNAILKAFSAKVYMSKTEIDYYNYKCNYLNPIIDGDSINIGDTKISCILTPGHTIGSMCFLLDGAMFTGDTVFIEGCGICDTKGGCAGSMFESINRIKRDVDGSTRIFPGHTFNKSIGCSLDLVIKENFYFNIDKKEYFIQFRERENQNNNHKFR